MKIIKIGGINFQNPSSLLRISEICDFFEDQKLIIIISAFNSTSSDLKNFANIARFDHAKSLDLLKSIFNFHKEFIKVLNISKNKLEIELENCFTKLSSLAYGINLTQEIPPAIYDEILSAGEFMALAIVAEYLETERYNFELINAKDYILTNNKHLQASPIFDICIENIKNQFIPILNESSNKIILTQGFVGKELSGKTTTMGFESSNLTALLIASALEAEEINIITNVNGIYNCNPSIFESAIQIPNISYNQAEILANLGLKLIFPSMINLVKEKGLKIIYRSFEDVAGISSVVSNIESKNIFMVFPNNTDVNKMHVLHFYNITFAFVSQLTHKLSTYFANQKQFKEINIIYKSSMNTVTVECSNSDTLMEIAHLMQDLIK